MYKIEIKKFQIESKTLKPDVNFLMLKFGQSCLDWAI